MSKRVRVILNGDDFGYSRGVNRGIIESIENGILTSTSVMVRRPAAGEAKALPNLKNISVGLHLDLTEEGMKRWSTILQILSWPEKKIREEFMKQIDVFENIVGRLPDHIDSHHHIHRLTRFKHVVEEFAHQNDIPVRSVNARFVTGFFGRSLTRWNDPRGVSPERLIQVIEKLPAGVNEIMCHPAYVDDGLLTSGTSYLTQRTREVEALTSPKVKEYIEAHKDTIKLISWKDVEIPK